MSIPKPTPWVTLHVEDKEEHRYWTCEHYGDCLNLAAESRWESFTCIYCPCNKLLKEEEWKRLERMKKLRGLRKPLNS